jgi:hypothetical protein
MRSQRSQLVGLHEGNSANRHGILADHHKQQQKYSSLFGTGTHAKLSLCGPPGAIFAAASTNFLAQMASKLHRFWCELS